MDFLLLPAFLDRVTREEIVSNLRASRGQPATVYGTESGGVVHVGVRSATRITVPADLQEAMLRRLNDVKPELERYFGITLSHCEEPQFLHYREGDFFVAHQDGNTSLIRDEARHRRVSIVLFLNEQSSDMRPDTYGGGDLLFHGAYPDWTARHAVAAEPGALVAFRSETTHEVTPVTRGDRYTVVTWFR